MAVAVDFRLVDQHVEVALELKERGGNEAVEPHKQRGKDAMGDAQVVKAELFWARLRAKEEGAPLEADSSLLAERGKKGKRKEFLFFQTYKSWKSY